MKLQNLTAKQAIDVLAGQVGALQSRVYELENAARSAAVEIDDDEGETPGDDVADNVIGSEV